MPDAHKNFAYSTVATAPSPDTTGTSLVVQTGEGGRFPTPPFNATVWPAGDQPLPANAEIVRVTAISVDTMTITRTQESTTARAIQVGDQIAATITAKTLQDVEGLVGAWASYAVTWTALTTNPSIGNGTLTGRFIRVGKMVTAAIKMIPGTTTTFGNGEWRFSMPSEATDIFYVGSAYALDAGQAHHAGVSRIADMGPSRAGCYGQPGAAYSAISPFVWAAGTGDVLFLTLSYEEA